MEALWRCKATFNWNKPLRCVRNNSVFSSRGARECMSRRKGILCADKGDGASGTRQLCGHFCRCFWNFNDLPKEVGSCSLCWLSCGCSFRSLAKVSLFRIWSSCPTRTAQGNRGVQVLCCFVPDIFHNVTYVSDIMSGWIFSLTPHFEHGEIPASTSVCLCVFVIGNCNRGVNIIFFLLGCRWVVSCYIPTFRDNLPSTLLLSLLDPWRWDPYFVSKRR
jgi:hypothetical protein